MPHVSQPGRLLTRLLPREALSWVPDFHHRLCRSKHERLPDHGGRPGTRRRIRRTSRQSLIAAELWRTHSCAQRPHSWRGVLPDIPPSMGHRFLDHLRRFRFYLSHPGHGARSKPGRISYHVGLINPLSPGARIPRISPRNFFAGFPAAIEMAIPVGFLHRESNSAAAMVEFLFLMSLPFRHD